jgi:glycosyltransferase involved in cell wall biosynthesis
MYSGNFGLGHTFDALVLAARSSEIPGRFRLALVGGGKKKQEVLDQLAELVDVGRVVSEPYQAREVVPVLLAAADVHVVSLASGCEGTMVPSKFFGILAARRPVIYIGHKSGEVGRIIEEIDCGMVVSPEDPHALLDAITALTEQPDLRERLGENAWRASTGIYSRGTALAQWSDLIENPQQPPAHTR